MLPVDEQKMLHLSKVDAKRVFYADDTFFRLAFEAFERSKSGSALEALSNFSIVVIKPEALMLGRTQAILQFLLDHGFEFVLWEKIQLSDAQCEQIWRYQWNRATLDRIQLQSRMMTVAPSFVLIVKSDASCTGLPASVRLRALKGASNPALRSSDDLRTILKSPNRLVNFVHSTDEPADFVREMGCLFPMGELEKKFAEALKMQKMSQAQFPIDERGFSYVPNSQEALDWFLEICSEASQRTLLKTCLDGRNYPSLAFLSSIAKDAGVSVSDWQFMLNAALLIETEIPKSNSLISESGYAEWLTHNKAFQSSGSIQ